MCERELETEQNCNIIDPHNRVSFPFSWAAQPGAWAQPLWGLVFSTPSYLQLVWSLTAQSRVPRPLSAGCCFLYSIIFKFSLNFLSTELYNSSTFTQSLPINGQRNMACFDHHRAEKTVVQFTGHPLPVHQFVTVPWDFNPVPYCQPSSFTPTEHATSTVFGMACLSRSEVNIQP